MNEVLLGVIWYAVFIFSLTIHEAGHAYAAMRGGDLTAYRGGQVSLDPMPHIRREPFGTVLVPLMSFAFSGWMIGWATTPYDPRWAWDHPRRAGWMALAGPTGNLLLVIAAAVLIRIGVSADVFYPPAQLGFTQITAAAGGLWSTLAVVLSILFTLNLLLLVFNLIPLPPLDGSGVIALFVSGDTARRVQQLMSRPQLALVGLIVAWFAIGRVFGPVFGAAVSLLYPEVSYGRGGGG